MRTLKNSRSLIGFPKFQWISTHIYKMLIFRCCRKEFQNAYPSKIYLKIILLTFDRFNIPVDQRDMRASSLRFSHHDIPQVQQL